MVRTTILRGLTLHNRELDEKAAIQRAKEEAAEAKIKAMRGGASRIPDRTAAPVRPEPTTSSERSGGPPRLALAGNKPTWRERQAAKEAEGTASSVPPAAPPTDIASDEVSMPPKKTGGYVPPARRNPDTAPVPRGRTEAALTPAPPRDTSSSVEPTAKWRPGGARDGLGRDNSPADAPPRRNLDGLRKTAADRDSSPADGRRPVASGATRTESPAAERAESLRPAPGKYVPVHMRNKG